MSVAATLAEFKASVAQCDSLISNAHQLQPDGTPFLAEIDRRQITVAAFLNMFISWETFLETTLALLLSGSQPMSGNAIVKYASPLDPDRARKMLVGAQKYFDYANHQNFSTIVNIYLAGGAPFQPHIKAIYSYLDDLRTMRNSSAHHSSTTRTALEALALRLLGKPSPGISLYDLLTANDPKTSLGATILETYKGHLLVTAELIANG